jgi:hypothetical protein
MSRFAKGKHVLTAALQDEVAPPGPGQVVVKALGSRGGNLIEVQEREREGANWESGGGGRRAAAARPAHPRPPSLTNSHTPTLSLPPPQVERPDGSTFFAVLPARFHKRLWVKRGGYLIVDAPDGTAGGGEAEGEAEAGASALAAAAAAAAASTAKGPGKVAGVIAAVLYEPDVRRLKAMPGVWPPEFGEAEAERAGVEEEEGAGGGGGGGGGDDGGHTPSSDDGLPPLEANPNQRRYEHAYSEEEEEE